MGESNTKREFKERLFADPLVQSCIESSRQLIHDAIEECYRDGGDDFRDYLPPGYMDFFDYWEHYGEDEEEE